MSALPLPHVALLVLVAAVWGFNFIVIRWGLDALPPLLFSALRFIICAIPAFVVPRPRLPLSTLVALGFVLGAAVLGFLFVGIALGVDPWLASILMQTHVLGTIVLAHLLLGERQTAARWSSVALGLLGMTLLATQSVHSGTTAGFACILAGAMSWAVANLIFRRLPPEPMLPVMVWISLVPPVPLLALSWWLEDPFAVVSQLPLGSVRPILAILYTSVLSTLFGYGAWGFLLQRHAVSQVTPFALLVPVFGLLFSALFLDARLAPVQWAAAGLVMAALAIAAGLTRPLKNALTTRRQPPLAPVQAHTVRGPGGQVTGATTDA
jgi:O-acetylserine/cysteine efflux transporter